MARYFQLLLFSGLGGSIIREMVADINKPSIAIDMSVRAINGKLYDNTVL